jgi:soluble lytic murein transglycosylase
MPREHPLSWHRLLPVALIGVLAIVALAAVEGPSSYRKLYYPLKYRAQIDRASRASGVDPFLVTAVVHAESDFDAAIVSNKGAVGLMQVMPDTAEDIERGRGRRVTVSASALRDPEKNVGYGAEYLQQLLKRYHGDRSLALAAYNAGILNADRWQREGGSPANAEIGFPQTRSYVEKVLKERDTYARLYPEAYPWQKQ